MFPTSSSSRRLLSSGYPLLLSLAALSSLSASRAVAVRVRLSIEPGSYALATSDAADAAPDLFYHVPATRLGAGLELEDDIDSSGRRGLESNAFKLTTTVLRESLSVGKYRLQQSHQLHDGERFFAVHIRESDGSSSSDDNGHDDADGNGDGEGDDNLNDPNATSTPKPSRFTTALILFTIGCVVIYSETEICD